MTDRKWIYGTLLLLSVLSGILSGIVIYTKNSHDFKVIFFDVGQGDAILISQGNNQVLIDGGQSGKTILEKLGRYVPFWDRNIEIVITTHPDADHIGGLADVLKTYKVANIIKTNAKSNSQAFQVLEQMINNKGAQKIEAVEGLIIKFSEGVKADILYPSSSITENNAAESNDNSVVVKLNAGKNSFLFTGDLPAEKEVELINMGSEIKSDILKLAHHGSKYSTTQEFINAVNPKEAVISVGKNNSYGHPAPEVLERLFKNGVRIYRTDEIGDIIYHCKVQSEKCKVEFE